MFRVNYNDLGNSNINCVLCGESNTGNPLQGRLVTHSNSMNCAAHVTCLLERLGNSNDPTCPTCNFPVNPPKAHTEEERKEKLQERTFEKLDLDLPKVVIEDTTGDAELAERLQLEEEQRNAERSERERLELEELKRKYGNEPQQPVINDGERAELEALQQRFNEEQEPIQQPRNPCLRQLTPTQAVWLALAVLVVARLVMRA